MVLPLFSTQLKRQSFMILEILEWKLTEKWKLTTSFVFGCCSTAATFVNFTTVHIATNWYRALKLLEYLVMNAWTLGRYNSWSYWVFHSCHLKYQYHLPIPPAKNCCPWSKDHFSHWMDKIIIYGPLHEPSPQTTPVYHPSFLKMNFTRGSNKFWEPWIDESVIEFYYQSYGVLIFYTCSNFFHFHINEMGLF